MENKIPKQKRIKTKIKSKPIQQKNSIKSNVSFPNLKKKKNKKKENVIEPVLTIWWWQICSLTVLIPIDFSFPLCLQWCSKSEEGTENSLLLSYFSVFALSKPKSYVTPNFKKWNQNLMLPKYLNKNQSNQISQN